MPTSFLRLEILRMDAIFNPIEIMYPITWTSDVKTSGLVNNVGPQYNPNVFSPEIISKVWPTVFTIISLDE